MRRHLLNVWVALLVLFVIWPTFAWASITTYTYSGNPFTNFSGADACPPECSMTGFFSIAGPPPANLSGPDAQFQFDVNPLTYSFSDGLVVATPANSNFDFFSITTDGAGQITSWDIRIFTPAFLGGTFVGTQLLINNIIDITIVAPAAVDFTAIPQNPGTWVTTISGVPEPSTWAMMLIGFAALGFVGRRFKASAAAATF